MLKIWGRNNSINVQKVMWALGELKLAHERIDIGGAFGKNKEPPYLAMNPNGLVPTLEEDDGFLLWESNAIVCYLAAKHGAGTLWPTDLHERASSDRWMDWISNHVSPVITPVFWGLIRTPAEQRKPAQIAADAEKTAQQFQVLEACLAGRSYVAGQTFTIGDIVVGVTVNRWYGLDVQRPRLANVEAYYARLQQRPAFKRHVMLPLT